MPPGPSPLFIFIRSSLLGHQLPRPSPSSHSWKRSASQQTRFRRIPFRRQSFHDRWRTQNLFRIGVGLGVVSTGFIAWNLERVPESGRLRFNCVPASVESRMGARWYKELIQDYNGQILPKAHPYSKMVDRVLKRLVAGLGEGEWEGVVIHDDSTMNAFVLPGGKVFVFSGMIPICENDDGLASVLGHEIAHIVTHHMGEKLSAIWALTWLAYALAVSFNLPLGVIDNVLDIAYTRPGSRRQESEADYIGLSRSSSDNFDRQHGFSHPLTGAVIMAKACYRLEDALKVKERFMRAENAQGEQTPQFLSTHPSSDNRIKKMSEWLPKAKEIQSTADCGGVMEHVDDFHRAFEMQIQADNDRGW